MFYGRFFRAVGIEMIAPRERNADPIRTAELL
jgi:hypothetical protein